jgi:hypothetical protein
MDIKNYLHEQEMNGYPDFKNDIIKQLVTVYKFDENEAKNKLLRIEKIIDKDMRWAQHMGVNYWAKIISKSKESNNMNNRMIDGLIAELLFDWEWHESEYMEIKRKMLIPPIGDEKRLWTGMWGENGVPNYCPYYSTSLTDAWLIVEKLKQEDQYLFRLENGDLYDYECWFDNYRGEGNTAPMAICMAALKVYEVYIKE